MVFSFYGRKYETGLLKQSVIYVVVHLKQIILIGVPAQLMMASEKNGHYFQQVKAIVTCMKIEMWSFNKESKLSSHFNFKIMPKYFHF